MQTASGDSTGRRRRFDGFVDSSSYCGGGVYFEVYTHNSHLVAQCTIEVPLGGKIPAARVKLLWNRGLREKKNYISWNLNGGFKRKLDLFPAMCFFARWGWLGRRFYVGRLTDLGVAGHVGLRLCLEQHTPL